ncbi:MAG: PKD domain-containing protein, partial [candidate division Zixibacteria bacterium]|nr:PKD domain-containing protein [candidate division Zixibacteria bacterium]
PGANLLNTMAADTSGNIYVSDGTPNMVYKIKLGTHALSPFVWFGLPHAVGLLFDPDNNRLLVTTDSAGTASIKAVSCSDSTDISLVLATGLPPLDMLSWGFDGSVYTSCWETNSVYRYDPTFSAPPVVVSTGHNGPAQLCYNESDGVLAVPCFMSSSIAFLYPDADFTVDTAWGRGPLSVHFTGTSSYTPEAWHWDFGDGGTSDIQSPDHAFEQPGLYDVSLQVTIDGVQRTRTFPGCVAVVADTLRGETLEIAAGATVEYCVESTNHMPLNGLTIPLHWDGPLGLEYVSHTVSGCRTGDFNDISVLNFDPIGKRLVIELAKGTAAALPVGSGTVLRVTFNQTEMSPEDRTNAIGFEGYGAYEAAFEGTLGTYAPDLAPGVIELAGCCLGTAGNVQLVPDCDDGDQSVDVGDLTNLIDHLFIGFAPVCCLEEADVAPLSGPDGGIDVGDLTTMIDHLFITFPALPSCR